MKTHSFQSQRGSVVSELKPCRRCGKIPRLTTNGEQAYCMSEGCSNQALFLEEWNRPLHPARVLAEAKISNEELAKDIAQLQYIVEINGNLEVWNPEDVLKVYQMSLENTRADSPEVDALHYIATEKTYWQCEKCKRILRESETVLHEGIGEYSSESEYIQCPQCGGECDEIFASQVAQAVLDNSALAPFRQRRTDGKEAN